MKAQKKQKKTSMALLLLAIAFFLIYLSLPEEEEIEPLPPSQLSAYSPKVQELVNKHLHLTQKKIDIQQQQANVRYRAPEVGEPLYHKGSSNELPSLEFPTDASKSHSNNQMQEFSPEASVMQELQDQELRSQFNEAYRQEYARQFIENARRNGWDVRLDENYVVIQVRPIKNKPKYNLFDPTGSGSK